MSDGYDYLRFMRQFEGYWAQEAAKAILTVHQEIPSGASLAERTKTIDAAYPFGERKYFAYKQWLKVRRAYLVLFGYERAGRGKAKVGRDPQEVPLPLIYESPLERAKRKSGSINTTVACGE